MSKKPLCVAILWHMHQPDYGNAQTGEIYLPWTRFHAIKDYYDMAALLAEEPGLHLTVNLAPVLMDQLRAYGEGTAKETYAALTLRDATELDAREKSFLLRSFFQLPWKQMVLPYPRFKQLLERRGAPDERGDYPHGLKHYTTQDYRDLQVWFNLSWSGRELRREPDVATLISKGRDFSEEEKQHLLKIQNRLIRRILPFYARLMREQGIEISVSPYYHPILPLLCDNRTAREALPDIRLPSNPFAFPKDAQEQIWRAQQRYLKEFGQLPKGMWPSEGSISDATALLAREAGLRWLASDEGVLYQSMRKERRVSDHLSEQQKFSAYQWGEGTRGPCFFFRDHALSDLIGFTYSRWKPADAATDFLHRLGVIYQNLPDDGRHYVVPVILDGENAWEHYPENGAEFLGLLYRGLTQDKHLRSVTFSEYLEIESHRETLRTIVSGSWIYNNFATWIGHPEKNRAWDFLTAARNLLASHEREGSHEENTQKGYQELMIAEGSDWFWWCGDDHYTDNAAEFDLLFRNHVKNVYRFLDRPYPLELDVPIKKASAKIHLLAPAHTISPCIDGKVTNYFEWLSAGFVTAAGTSGSMHQTERFLEKIFFGYDARQFYLRLDLAGNRQSFPANAHIQIQFVAPRECLMLLERDQDHSWNCRWVGTTAALLAPKFAAGRIIELAIPLDTLALQNPGEARFFVAVMEKYRELERLPPHDLLVLAVDPRSLDQQEWIV